ncbi:MAG: tRNA (adenosine(37)-N6)-dimethylallyltransferase MiaA [Candidatus Uhrbacteria bacterium]
MPSRKSKIVVIVGATGSGKTDLGIALAKEFNGEVISADSRAIYRGMDIGTAKPIASEGKIASLPMRSSRGAASDEGPPMMVDGVPHWLFDIRNPDERYSVAEFQRDATRCARDVIRRGKLPIIVGGTMLYVQALVDNFDIPSVRAQPSLRARLEKKSCSNLYRTLQRLDSDAARVIDRHNVRRLIRALEVCLVSGKPFSDLRRRHLSPFDFFVIGVERSRPVLYRRLDQRTRQQLRDGLIEEAAKLLKRYGPDVAPLRGFMYREVVAWLQMAPHERPSLSALARQIGNANHAYARRQLTWWRRDKRIHRARTSQQALRLAREFIEDRVVTR